MIVTRQSNYYDAGAFSVEIAAELDYAGPGALSSKFNGDFAESDDPREIAEIAIKLRKEWYNSPAKPDVWLLRNDPDAPYIPFTLAMNPMIYATVNDGMTAAGLRRWAKERYETMLKCDYCGDIPAQEYTFLELDDIVIACSEYHAERLHEQNFIGLEDYGDC
jgi:hypothetical protein